MADLRHLIEDMNSAREELAGDLAVVQHNLDKLDGLIDAIFDELHDELDQIIGRVNAL